MLPDVSRINMMFGGVETVFDGSTISSSVSSATAGAPIVNVNSIDVPIAIDLSS